MFAGSIRFRRGIEINNLLKWDKNSGAQMDYGVFYFRSNGLKIRRSNGLYFGAQTSDLFRSNVLPKRSNVLRRFVVGKKVMNSFQSKSSVDIVNLLLGGGKTIQNKKL